MSASPRGTTSPSAEMFEPAVVDPIVDLLAELAGGGRALELGIGTGRIALPLARRGVPVHGIELSKAMAARLRAKPGGGDIGVTIGDFATTTVDGTFSRRLPGLQHDHEPDDAGGTGRVLPERRRAPRAGRLLRHRGRRSPELQRLPPGETVRAFHVSETKWGFDEYDVASQGLTSHHFELVDGRRRAPVDSVPLRAARGARPDGGARRA